MLQIPHTSLMSFTSEYNLIKTYYMDLFIFIYNIIYIKDGLN